MTTDPGSPRRKRLAFLARTRLMQLGLLAAALIASTTILRFGVWTAWERLLIALIPALPLASIIATYTVLVRAKCFDEFGRRVLLEAAATVFLAGLPLLLLYGMVRNADVGAPPLDWQAVFAASVLLWGLGVVASLRRHQGFVNWTRRGAREAAGERGGA